MSFYNELQKDINKIVGNLNEEEKLIEVLKRKLTKKEFKYYKLKIQNTNEDEIIEQLKCDKQRFEEIKKQTILKLNQEKIKKELVSL